MNLWLAAFGSTVCALAGVALGRWCSRWRSTYWTLGYFLPMVLVVVYGLAYHVPALLFQPPVSWMMMGLRKFAVMGFIATLVLTTPLSRVPERRNRVAIGVLMALIVFFMSIWPFIAPMVDRQSLSQLHTQIDEHGICIQTTGYTCGPAAAVTGLRQLGLPAEEGQIAILSCTSVQEGTPTDMLSAALNRQYGADGLTAQCRAFHSVGELKQAGLTLAVVKYGLLVDHWVAVLAVTDSAVIIGDPLGGRQQLSYEEFAERWRFVGIVLHRQGTTKT